MQHNQLPPQNIEAEMSVLGAILMEGDCLKKVTGLIDGGDFYRESHRKIFHAMLQCQITDTPIDLITLSSTLKASGNLLEVGGGAYLAVLSDYVPMSANVGHYCKLVKEAAVRRKVILMGQSMVAFGYGGDPLDEGLKDAKTGIVDLMGGMDSFGGVSVQDITTVDQRAERYIRQVKTLDKNRFVTSFYYLDSLIRGVAPGEVMTIIAEPGGFKTAFLQNLLQRGAKRTGLYHLFFSLEMPLEKVFEREAQISSGHVGREVEKLYREMGDEAEAVQAGLYANGSKGLLVCDKPGLDIDKIRRYIELAGTKFGKVNAIGIDYLGLMAAPGKLFERMEFICRGIKNLAKEMNVPIIMLCQINREGAKNNTHDILITDAKGGGDIEAGADIMLGFYHDAEKTLVCKILKNRNGANGMKLEVKINKEAFQFQDMVPYQEPELVKKCRPAVNRKKTELPE